MTPDELRRMDNDLCIIYEKGIKPVKDEKYYYFETPMARKLAEVTLNHLEFNVGDRGKWRKFNPYNPYVEDQEEKPKDLKVESLDDLFDDEPVQSNENDNVLNDNVRNNQSQDINGNMGNSSNINNQNIEAPMLPQDDETKRSEDDIMSVDVQKELEAKFDELFGAFDEDEN